METVNTRSRLSLREQAVLLYEYAPVLRPVLQDGHYTCRSRSRRSMSHAIIARRGLDGVVTRACGCEASANGRTCIHLEVLAIHIRKHGQHPDEHIHDVAAFEARYGHLFKRGSRVA